MIYLQDPDVTILLGDAAEQLRSLPDESVHMAVTSPPFYGLRDYGVQGQIGLEETPDEWCARLVDVFREVRRVLRRDGTLWLEVGSSFASGGTQPTRSRPGAPACGSDGTALPGSPAPDSACPDLCDGCLADYLSHRDRNERTIQPPARDAQQPEQTSRDSERRDSERADALAAPADAQESTTLASWLALRGECSGCSSRRASVARLGLHSWLNGAAPSAHSSACNGGTTRQQRTSADRTSDTEPSVLAWGHYTSTLKPKDLIPTPWMLAMALRADGWYLRADIIWHRPNPMPESVTDRPTKAHSYLFLLSKSARYFYDADAIREDFQTDPSENYPARARILGRGEQGYPGEQQDKSGGFPPKGSGRNKRSVWTIPTQPLAHDHYAAYPEKLVEPCILAGTSEHGVCSVCGAPWERETEKSIENPGNRSTNGQRDRTDFVRGFDVRREISVTTTGWRPGCDHDAPTIPATVLDPFLGSGTTSIVARRLGRRSIGVELNPKYAELAAGRLSQQSLLALEGA